MEEFGNFPHGHFEDATVPMNNIITNDAYHEYNPALGITYPAQEYSVDAYARNDSYGMTSGPATFEPSRQYFHQYHDSHSDHSTSMPTPSLTNTPYTGANCTSASVTPDLAQHDDSATDPDQHISRDNELLSLKSPTYSFTLLDSSLQQIKLDMTARLHGMFFVADPPTTPPLNQVTTIPEITCYRRNLFQVTGAITMPRAIQYIQDENGVKHSIISQELQISATESVDGAPVKLISVPWKTPVSGTPPPGGEDKGEKEPVTIPLDLQADQDIGSEFATFPIAWKRLQFRIATANNGRRRELQQHFTVHLKFVVTLDDGTSRPVAEACSTAVIVRGRSPRNFQSKKEQPVGNDRGLHRKGHVSTTSLTLSATGSEESIKPTSHKRRRSVESDTYTQFGAESATPRNMTPTSHAADWNNAPSSMPNVTSVISGSRRMIMARSASPSINSMPSTPQVLPLTSASDIKRPASARPNKAPRLSSYKNSRAYPYPRGSQSSMYMGEGFMPIMEQPKMSPSGFDSTEPFYDYVPLGPHDWAQPIEGMYQPPVMHYPGYDVMNPTKAGMMGPTSRYLVNEGRGATAI